MFELGDTLAREVMVPRTEMVWIEADKTLRQALSLGLRSGFSRIPVIAENLDDVVGVVYLKDVARRIFEDRGSERNEHVDTVMREAHFIPDSKRADDLLRDMQAARVHMSIVVDEYGGTAGLVTIEDILEEIVGEITDEYDNEVPEVEELATDRYRVSARLVSMTSPSSCRCRSAARARTWIPSAGCSDVGWGGSDPRNPCRYRWLLAHRRAGGGTA